jgi:transcription antitermination factor NusG
MTAGTKVYIERGPLAGIEGLITRADKGFRLVVSVTLLQRSLSIEIDRDWVRPISATASGSSVSHPPALVTAGAR